MEEKILIISGVNLVEGGPLSVYKDCLASLVKWKPANLHVIALVNSPHLFREFSSTGITFIEYPDVKKSWIGRLVFEYHTCMGISKKYKPAAWLAMHDMTPNVIAAKRIVYCHNPAAFYTPTIREVFMEKSLLAFKLFYRLLYGINIKKNDFIIVQQNWIRGYFKKWYHVNKVIVAYPQINIPPLNAVPAQSENGIFRFLYPAFPRVFKNFEILFNAAIHLSTITKNFQVIVTITGNENKYAAALLKKYGHLPFINFAGLQPRDKMWELYNNCACLVFPSKLETWGLPITEMKLFNKPVLVAGVNYAYETVGQYDKASFFDPADEIQLAGQMRNVMDGTIVFDKINFTEPEPYFTKTWEELFSLVFD